MYEDVSFLIKDLSLGLGSLCLLPIALAPSLPLPPQRLVQPRIEVAPLLRRRARPQLLGADNKMFTLLEAIVSSYDML